MEAKIEELVNTIMRRGGIISWPIWFLRKIGITQWVRTMWVRAIYRKESKNPTDEMIEWTKFYDEHKSEVLANTDLLADKKSKEVYKKMISFRCTHEVKEFPAHNIRNQYFDPEIVPVRKDYVFIDGGAYTGDTVEAFMKYCGDYKSIVCFEPDPDNIKALKRNTRNDHDIEVIPKGMWSERDTLSLTMDQVSSRISEDGEIKIEVTAIDAEEKCRDASFIKMDIEGSEMKALEGAIETIKRNRPVLAICIYHSNEDMINIIPWINNLNLAYKLYVRHHSIDINDTVLYAIPE